MKAFQRFRSMFLIFLCLSVPGAAFAGDDDQVTPASLAKARGRYSVVAPNAHASISRTRAAAGIPNIDSLLNFSGQYRVFGYDPSGNPTNVWYFNTVGRPPTNHVTTTFQAPIVPVSLDLRNSDGSPRFVNGKRLYYDATQFVPPTLGSPVFQNFNFSTSKTPTQITDAIQRASYWNDANDDENQQSGQNEGGNPTWHTLLAPSVKTPRVMRLLRGSYQFSLNADGSCCRFVLVDANTFVNALFPATAADTATPVGAAENAGEITTKDIASFLFPNTFLVDAAGCCILGFHTYDSEPGDAGNGNVEKRYVLNYSSWISPGLFGGGFQDVTALSHEIAEIYNDPFVASDGVHNVTPWWLAPNGLCQDDLETGDVIEGLPNAVFPITMPNGYTYHPQNEALLQYFEFQEPSSAFHGAYSYPDTTVLTSPSSLQRPGCPN